MRPNVVNSCQRLVNISVVVANRFRAVSLAIILLGLSGQGFAQDTRNGPVVPNVAVPSRLADALQDGVTAANLSLSTTEPTYPQEPGFRAAGARDSDKVRIPEMLVTEHAFIEKSLGFKFLSANNADGGEVDESEFAIEAFWQLSDCFAVVIEAPFVYLDPVEESNIGGFGDLEVGFRFVMIDIDWPTPHDDTRGAAPSRGFRSPGSAGRVVTTDQSTGRRSESEGPAKRFIFTTGLNITTPTGDADRELGEGHTTIEPVALVFWDLGDEGGTAFQAGLGLGVPIGPHEEEQEFTYNLALSHTLQIGEPASLFPYLTPLVEINGKTFIGGDESGETVINLTPGFQLQMCKDNLLGFGISFPITGREDFDSQLLVTFVRDF